MFQYEMLLAQLCARHLKDITSKLAYKGYCLCEILISFICSMSNIKFLVTVGEGKYFSTGVDMDIVKSSDPNDFVRVLSDLQQLLSRLLVFPLVTVAAINGKLLVLDTLEASTKFLSIFSMLTYFAYSLFGFLLGISLCHFKSFTVIFVCSWLLLLIS